VYAKVHGYGDSVMLVIRIVMLIGLLCAGFVALLAQPKLELTTPVVTNWGALSGLNATQRATIESSVQSSITTAQNLANAQLAKLSTLNKLTRGFANANSMVGISNASLGAYQNYDLFAITLGANIGAALPLLTAEELPLLFESIQKEGDVYAGIGTGGIALQVGINTSKFLVKDLYLNAKIGFFHIASNQNSGSASTSVEFNQFLLGIGANYQLIPPTNVALGLFNWRGLSLGAGLVYNQNLLDLSIAYPDQTNSSTFNVFDLTGATITDYTTIKAIGTISNLKTKFGIVSRALSIPVDLTTSLQLLWVLNLGLGVGLDINIPGSAFTLGGSATAGATIQNQYGQPSDIVVSPAQARLTSSGYQSKPEFFDIFSPRVQVNLGFNLAIFKLDIPVVFYPVSKAISAGFTLGVVY